MLQLTKASFAVMGLVASSAALAGMSGEPQTCTSEKVTVPCEARLWDLGVRALYLKSVYDADHAYASNFNAQINEYKEIDNEWGWGFRIEGSYHFNTGNDISLNWTHYDKDADQNNLFSRFIPVPGFPPGFLARYNLWSNNTFNQVNLVMGQHADFGLIKDIHFYGGLQYIRIRAETESTFTNIPPFNPLITSIQRNSLMDSKGWGPVVGVDYDYDLSSNFSVVANAASSIIYGNGRYSSYVVANPNKLVLNQSYATKKILITSFEAQLGVNYNVELAMGALNLEAGYQVINYFNALQTRGASTLGLVQNTDFGLYGPYFGVHWVGDA